MDIEWQIGTVRPHLKTIPVYMRELDGDCGPTIQVSDKPGEGDIYTSLSDFMEDWGGSVAFFNALVPEPVRRQCQCCGAVEGEVHHQDPWHPGRIVRLRLSRVRQRLECQLCNDGLAAVARDKKRKAEVK